MEGLLAYFSLLTASERPVKEGMERRSTHCCSLYLFGAEFFEGVVKTEVLNAECEPLGGMTAGETQRKH